MYKQINIETILYILTSIELLYSAPLVELKWRQLQIDLFVAHENRSNCIRPIVELRNELNTVYIVECRAIDTQLHLIVLFLSFIVYNY